MQDRLSITDLELRTRIGVTEDERANDQRLLVTVEMETDAAKVALHDDVMAGIDYGVVAADLRELAQSERKTIERFAEDAAAMILKKHRPPTVTITVKKFVIPGTADVRITITRSL